MKLKKDRDILQLVFKYGNMLLILPNFHFIEKEIGISPLRLINSVVLMLLIVCGYLISISGRIVHVYNHGDTGPIDSFLDFSTYFLLTVTNITIVLDSLMKRGAWKELLKFLLAADVFVSRKEYLLYTTLFVLLHIYYFLLFFFDSYVWLNAAEAPFYKYYFFRIVQEYMCLLMVFSMGIINSMLKARFKTLNNVLMDSRKIKNKVIHTLQKPIKVIDNATQQYIKLYNAVMLFNRIFSWQNFLIVTYAIFSILDNVEKALVHSSLKVNASSISYGKFFISLCVGSIAMVILNEFWFTILTLFFF